MKVLFAAKDAVICFLFGMVLREGGYEAVEAQHERQAWDLLEKDHVDICVIDLALPDAGGLELLRRLRADARFESIPVLLLVGETPSVAAIDEYFSCGADNWLRKPVEPQTFMLMIRALAYKGSTAASGK